MFDPDIVSFAHGEGIRRPYPEALHRARRALFDDAGSPIENYLYRRAFIPLDHAISAEFERLKVPADQAANIVIDAGSTRLIFAALSLFLDRGDLVVTGAGFYHPLAAWCDALGLELVVLGDDVDRGFRLSAEELDRTLETVRPGQRALLLLFNPTLIGAIYPQGELDAIAEVALAHRIVAIEDMLLDTADADVPSAAGRLSATLVRDQVITIAGASKQHCLANLRIGWACGPADIIHQLSERVCNASASIPHVAKAAALGALEATAAYRRGNVAEATRRLSLFRTLVGGLDTALREATGIAEPLVRVAFVPQGGHSVLLDFSNFARICGFEGRDVGPALTRFFLSNTGTAFAPVSSQGISGSLLRANVASVGTEFTYPVSREIEEAWPVEWDEACDARFTFAFARGRTVIARALEDRVLPAMSDAIRRNCRRSVEAPRTEATR